jgi:hypothetical protein
MSDAKKQLKGVQFPLNAKGKRSTIEFSKGVWAAAAAGLPAGSHGDGPDGSFVADAIRSEPDFRHGYAKHVVSVCELSVRSEANALRAAEQGLAALHGSMQFYEGGGGGDDGAEAPSVADAVAAAEAVAAGGAPCPFETGVVEGSGGSGGGDGAAIIAPLSAPPVAGAAPLSGQPLVDFVRALAAGGACEPSVADAVEAVVGSSSSSSSSSSSGGGGGGGGGGDVANKYAGRAALDGVGFVLLGANSEMGPTETLLSLGATVIAVSRPNEGRWAALLERARASPGKLVFPMRRKTATGAAAAAAGAAAEEQEEEEEAARAGADVIADLPALVHWLGPHGDVGSAHCPRRIVVFPLVYGRSRRHD